MLLSSRTIDYWRPQIERALRHALQTHAYDDIKRLVNDDKAWFLGSDRAFIIIEVVHYSRLKMLHGFLAGGELDALLDDFTDEIRRLANRLGCEYFSIAGRKGWERVLTGRGFRHTYSVMHRRVNGEAVL